MVVAIDFVDFATGYFASLAKDYFVGLAKDYFSNFSKEVGSNEKDSNNFGFATDYCKDLKIIEDPEAYLVLKPMVDVEQQRELDHCLHPSSCTPLANVESPGWLPTYIHSLSFICGNEHNTLPIVFQPLHASSS